MTIEEALYAEITEEATAVIALIGSRLYPKTLPQNPTTPAIAYQKISNRDTLLQRETSQIDRARLQFSCYGATYDAAKRLAQTLRAFLTPATVGYYPRTVQGVPVFYIQFLNEIDGYGDETEVYRVIVDFEVCHQTQ